MLLHIHTPVVTHDPVLHKRETFSGCVLGESSDIMLVVGKCIGIGAGGSVFEVQQAGKMADFVLKIHRSPDEEDELPIYVNLGLIGRTQSLAEILFLATHRSLSYIPILRIRDAFRVQMSDGRMVNAYSSDRMLFDLSGPYLSLTGQQFIRIAFFMLWAVQYMHEGGYCHLDLKLSNMCMDRAGRLYVVDLGSSESFLTTPDRSEDFDFLHGNIFSSRDLHRGLVCGPSSDIESIAYCLMCWLAGSLPWGRVKSTSRAGNMRMCMLKSAYCRGEGDTDASMRRKVNNLVLQSIVAGTERGRVVFSQAIDSRLVEFLVYSLSLEHSSPPDYDKLRGILYSMVHE